MDDTDTLLSLLSSLLVPPVRDQMILLDALVECNGNVKAAARLLRAKHTLTERGKKRKRSSGLDDWLKASPATPSSAGPSANPFKPPSRRVRANSSELPQHNSNPPTSSGSSSNKPPSPAPSVAEAMDTKCASSSSRVKPVSQSEFMDMLRPPNSEESTKSTPPRFPPLTLVTPLLVSQHTPCTLHPSILPPELACRLFHTMLKLSEGWQKNKWWLFDRVVESPHRTSFFMRRPPPGIETGDMQEAAQYWYNGRHTGPPAAFPPAMEEVCEMVERVVSAEMRKRSRFPLEWGGEPPREGDDAENITWRANVAAANCYEGGKDSVGLHSDQLTYLGPYATIASLSLGTSRVFRLREVIPSDEKEKRSARTYNIPLQHNSLIIMHASTQETFKHSIPPQNTIDLFHPPFPPPPSDDTEDEPQIIASNARINITFRFYRPDFRAELTPRCRCGVPCILRPDMRNRYSELSTSTVPPPNAEAGTSEAGQDRRRRDMVTKYWWTCYAGAQNEGKGCNFWKVMDVKAEGRGPFVAVP